MKHNSMFTKALFVLFVLFASLFVLSCSVGSSGATATPVPTNTPAATNTPLPTDTPAATDTPLPPPTETPVPEPPTPAPVGEAVRSESFEVTVVSAKELRRVYMGNYYYYPLAGQIYVELVVKVSNLTGSEISVPWENVYVVDEAGNAYYPSWGGYTAVKTGKTVDGSAVGVNEIVDSKATLDIEEDAYLRMIWFLDKTGAKTTALFGFFDSPYVEVVIE
jgi:hypothetical protein